MKVGYGKLNDCFAIIPHIDIKWIIHSRFKLYYIQFAWLLWCKEIIISFINDYDRETKKAVKIINELLNNDRLMKLSEEEYFLLLECVLGGEEPKIYSPTTPLKVPTLQCYEPNGVCTNPFHDCINCPKTTFHSDGAGTFTSTNIK